VRARSWDDEFGRSVIPVTDAGAGSEHNGGLVSLYISGAAAGFWPAAALFSLPFVGLHGSATEETRDVET
jgi:hypothetical protein